MIKPTDTHVVRSNGCAVIVPALSVSLFFDVLDEQQIQGLRAVWSEIDGLFRPRLKWYMTDSMAERRRLSADVFASVPDVLEQVAERRPYYFFRAHGGSAANCLDAWALDVWIDNPRRAVGADRALLTNLFGTPDEDADKVANCLRLSFPYGDEPIGSRKLESVTHRLMELMPFLHGHAGYALLFDDTSPAFEPKHWAALAELAMRHPGYDVLHYTAVRAYVYDKIKTADWLTLLGPDLARAVRRTAIEDSEHEFEITGKDGTLTLKAASEPEIGDINRDDRVPAYGSVATALENIVCSYQMEFGGAFDDDLTQAWVRRFDED